jgi:uncharacterized protein GlcG (DUF336 family)
MESINLETGSKIVDEALKVARAERMNPMTVVVLDAGGHFVCGKREDKSALLRFEIAYGKAWGALGMGRNTRVLEQNAQQRPWFIGSLSATSLGNMVPVPGGVLIRNAAKDIIGAVGVTGDIADKDEICAVRAVKALGLVPDPENEPALK